MKGSGKQSWQCFLLVLIAFVNGGCDLLDTGEPMDAPDAVTQAEALAWCGTEEDPFAETCLGDMGGPCWAPEGVCQESPGEPGALLTWESQHVVSFVPDLIESKVLQIEGRNSAGELCFRGTSRAYDDGSGEVALESVDEAGNPQGGILRSTAYGAVYLECAGAEPKVFSGTQSVVLEQCLYGKNGGVCDFGAATLLFLEDGGTSAVCTAAKDCPTGAQCCWVAGGGNYCSPVCL